MKRLCIVSLGVLAVAPLASVMAQEQLPPRVPGQRVRVTAPDCGLDRQSATFLALRSDTLVLSTTNCPLASVMRLDVHQGRESHAGAGAAYGALAGAAIGVASTVIICSREDCEEYTGLVLLVLGGGGTIAGLLIGSIVGALITTDRWEEIPLDALRVGVGPQRDGRFGLGLSVRF